MGSDSRDTLRPDLCVIGAGAAGLSVAAGAVQMGARVVLVERGAMGGDCLNTGCVPSKALIAAAAALRATGPERTAPFGIQVGPARLDWSRVRGHVDETIAAIAPHDSVERFEGLGVTVLRGQARFADPRTVVVTGGGEEGGEGGQWRVAPRRVVLATGSRPLVPEIPGLAEVPFLTNETLFDLPDLPRHLVILGGGPIGCEMAQAFRRLGAEVTVVEQAGLLGRDDEALVAGLRATLVAEGVDLREGQRAGAIRPAPDGGVAVDLVPATAQDSAPATVTGSHLLMALGRRPDLEALDLAAAGVAAGPGGITVDPRLRTTNRRVFALGDALDGPRFTHAAGYQAGVVIQNALLRLPVRADHRALPHVTFTDPELAQVGQTEAQARSAWEASGGRGRPPRVVSWSLADTDRARAERLTDRPAPGQVRVVLDGKGRILGAGILAPQAGEMIQPWVLAIQARLPLRRMAQMIAPYPTLGEASKRAAGAAFAEALFGPRVRALVRLLAHLG